MYRQQISRKTSPTQQSTPISQNRTPSKSFGPLSGVVQRATNDRASVSREERQQLDSAIGTRATKGIISGNKTTWTPNFTGITTQLMEESGRGAASFVQAEEKRGEESTNQTGLPDNLKSGIEHLSGYSMDDVKVHYNSDRPAQVKAHAYAQGTDIHLASGQEKHLPHEAWHVVQQKQGRVKTKKQLKGLVYINDDAELEKEADIMGTKAMQFKPELKAWAGEREGNKHVHNSNLVQRVITHGKYTPKDLAFNEWEAQKSLYESQKEVIAKNFNFFSREKPDEDMKKNIRIINKNIIYIDEITEKNPVHREYARKYWNSLVKHPKTFYEVDDALNNIYHITKVIKGEDKTEIEKLENDQVEEVIEQETEKKTQEASAKTQATEARALENQIKELTSDMDPPSKEVEAIKKQNPWLERYKKWMKGWTFLEGLLALGLTVLLALTTGGLSVMLQIILASIAAAASGFSAIVKLVRATGKYSDWTNQAFGSIEASLNILATVCKFMALGGYWVMLVAGLLGNVIKGARHLEAKTKIEMQEKPGRSMKKGQHRARTSEGAVPVVGGTFAITDDKEENDVGGWLSIIMGGIKALLRGIFIPVPKEEKEQKKLINNGIKVERDKQKQEEIILR